MVRDVDSGPDTPKVAQSLAGRDNPSQRAKVPAIVVGSPGSTIHGGDFPGNCKQIHCPQVRLGRLRLSQVRPVIKSR